MVHEGTMLPESHAPDTQANAWLMCSEKARTAAVYGLIRACAAHTMLSESHVPDILANAWLIRSEKARAQRVYGLIFACAAHTMIVPKA